MTTKQYLSKYEYLQREINSLQTEINLTRATALQVRTSNYSGMPRSKSHDTDAAFTRAIEDIDLLERKLYARIAEFTKLRKDIETAISAIEDNKLRTLLRLRYINNYTLEKIAVEMNYSYIQVCRLHGKALNLVKMI